MRSNKLNRQSGKDPRSNKAAISKKHAKMRRENTRVKKLHEKERSAAVVRPATTATTAAAGPAASPAGATSAAVGHAAPPTIPSSTDAPSAVYTHVALSLARGYTDLYYVNMDTDEFIEFHTDDEKGVLTEARRGSDFFEGCERDAKLYVHPDDQAAFVQAMDRQFLAEALAQTNVFELVYRRIKGADPFYVRMRVSRMEDDSSIVVIAVADVDEQVKQRRAEERMIEDRIIYARLHALTGNYICVYVVVPETGSYREFSSITAYEESFAQAKEGSDFFAAVRDASIIYSHPDDLSRFLAAFTEEKVLAEVERSGMFTLDYRLIASGKPLYVQLRAAMVEEREGRRLVVGVADIDAQVRQQEEYGRRLAQARAEATIDALTGVKNKHAYIEVEADLDRQIAGHRHKPFAITILDVNDLKKINDTAGHQAGDNYLRSACRAICDIFKRSPVFRVGGDEFAVISQGSDYERIEELLAKVDNYNAEAARNAGTVVACGMSKFEDDPCVAAVFERADRSMYENKNMLKSAQNGESANKYVLEDERRTALEALRQPFAIFQPIGKRAVTILLSDGFCNLFGFKSRSKAVCAMDDDMFKYVHPDDVARITSEASRFIAGEGAYDVVYRAQTGKGNGYSVVRATGERVYEDDGTHLVHMWYTDEGPYEPDSVEAGFEVVKTLSNALHAQSILKTGQYDYLTGLPNLTYFLELAEARKRDVQENGGQPAMLYIDFGDMRFFNTKHGFAEGDVILRSFARLLARTFGGESSCRIGSDRFTAIAEEEGLQGKLRSIFQEFEELHGGETPPIHVGVYPYAIEDVHASRACDRAKLACSVLEESLSSDFNYYSGELRDSALMRHHIIENLDTALREKWVQVYFQPIIRSVNEKVCDIEALARWVDPEKGMLSPADFIPVLEETGQIYKLDLYMVDRVLETIKRSSADGFSVVPHSINLSRADFDACDIVEEIRERVDAAGIARDRITIEVTESVVGSDFEFMKGQIERFQELGFPVWMDDFGSGYSALDVLQSIKFDLIKFDMNFMRRLDEGEDGKVLLTELMRMTSSLGVNALCEGVETESQVRFLQEIGCTKLQGFYYSETVPYDTILQKREESALIENENPAESDYFESMGRVNLYDLGIIAQEDESSIQNTFDTLPMGIIEIRGDSTRFVRSNRSYRDFIKRFFGLELSQLGSKFAKYDDAFMHNVVKTCCEQGLRSFYDEKMPDGSIVHSFARRIGTNPITGSVAVAVAVLSVTESGETTSYADIARALAADYYNIYVIDLDADTYVEYSSLVGGEELALERHGTGFFESARRDAMTRIHEGDRALFLSRFSKTKVIREIEERGVFTVTYRLLDTGEPLYVNMKITRLPGGNRLILGVNFVDEQIRWQEREKKLRQERAALGRVAALSENYLVLYTVDIDTGHYVQYNPSHEFEQFGLSQQGEDFFADVVTDASKAIPPEDMERHLSTLTEENMMREVRSKGRFVYDYRLLIDKTPVPVCLKAVLFEEDGRETILLGVRRAN